MKEKKMASKKKKKKIAKKIEKRKCAVCKKRGHNSRSHEPGGRLAA